MTRMSLSFAVKICPGALTCVANTQAPPHMIHVASALMKIMACKRARIPAPQAPACAISAMQFFGVSHPPAGAVSLIFISGPERVTSLGLSFLLFPICVGNMISVLMAMSLNNMSANRQYPMYW